MKRKTNVELYALRREFFTNIKTESYVFKSVIKGFSGEELYIQYSNADFDTYDGIRAVG